MSDKFEAEAKNLVYEMDLHDRGEIQSAEKAIASSLRVAYAEGLELAAEITEEYKLLGFYNSRSFHKIAKAIRAEAKNLTK